MEVAKVLSGKGGELGYDEVAASGELCEVRHTYTYARETSHVRSIRAHCSSVGSRLKLC